MAGRAWTTPVLSRATPSSLVVGLHLQAWSASQAHEHSEFEVQSRALPDIDVAEGNTNIASSAKVKCEWADHGIYEGHSRHTLIPLMNLKAGTQYQVRCRMKPLQDEEIHSPGVGALEWSEWSDPSPPLRTCSEQTTRSVFSDETRHASGTAWRYKFWSATASQWMAKPVVST